MTVQLNHSIVWCHDPERSATFLADILGRPAPRRFMHFMIVDLDNAGSLDFMAQPGDIALQHYAFLIGDDDFDAVLSRIVADGIDYWADPGRTQPNDINHHFGGRGVYFFDPNGHLLEVMTRPYAAD